MFKLGFISDGLAPLFLFISHHDDENLKRSSLHRRRENYIERSQETLCLPISKMKPIYFFQNGGPLVNDWVVCAFHFLPDFSCSAQN